MKLASLDPRWLNPHLFAFRCPHCPPGRAVWLTCKDVPMSHNEQLDLFDTALADDVVCGCTPSVTWTISTKDFASMSVTPSLDASASGHWHGFITNGEVV